MIRQDDTLGNHILSTIPKNGEKNVAIQTSIEVSYDAQILSSNLYLYRKGSEKIKIVGHSNHHSRRAIFHNYLPLQTKTTYCIEVFTERANHKISSVCDETITFTTAPTFKVKLEIQFEEKIVTKILKHFQC
jgi:hypothetical protein